MDDKKYTSENNNKNRVDEFEEFNFTDDFPEFSDEFMNKNYNDKDFLENVDDKTPPPPPPPPERKKGTPILKRHPWLILVVAIVIIFGFYKLISGLWSGDDEIQPVAKPTLSQPQAARTQSLPEFEGLKEGDRLGNLEKMVSVLNSEVNQMQSASARLAQLERMITKIAEEERDLSATLLRLDALNKQITALATLDQRIKELEAQMEVLASEVELHITVADQTQRAANLSRQAMQAKSMLPIPMVVQAAIPGRAWLLSETGELITVARGDDVPGYGRVLNIDPVAGTVTMSSETVFREKQ